MPSHNSYLGSDRFIQNTYEQAARQDGFKDDNKSGSVLDEKADYLKTIQRIKTKGDAGYYDMTPEQQQEYDQKNSFSNSGFKLIPPAPSAPGFLKNVVGELSGSEAERLMRMKELNGTTFDNGDRSQGDQEAEQRMVQNKKTGLLQKFINKVTKPFNDAFEKEFGTEDQPKYGGKDAVMYKGKFIHPDLYKMLMNRPDLEQRFTETGSIFGE